MDIFIPPVSAPKPFVIAAFVSSSLWNSLRKAVGEACRVIEAATWDDLAQIVRERAVDFVIVDPGAAGRASSRPIEQLLTRFPRTPMFVYTSMQVDTLRSVSALLRDQLEDVLLQGVDDAPESFQRLLDAADRKRAHNPIFDRLTAAVNRLPTEMRNAINELFRRPHVFLSVSDIAGVAGMTLNRFYRAFRSTAIEQPRRVFVAARVYRAYAYLREPGHAVRHVAAKLRYRHSRMLARHTRESLGVKPRQMRTRLAERAVIDRLVTWVHEPIQQESTPDPGNTAPPASAPATGTAAIRGIS
jgi:AraC-like DNA-binding protein